MQVTKVLAKRVLEVVDAGLVRGLGEPTPGKMCVEAAVCYAGGQPHGDKPTCVGHAVRAFKIRLNDAAWPSNAARAAGMRRLAIAQLGSDTIDQGAFSAIVTEQTIRQIVPIALRAAVKPNSNFAARLETAAKRCEVEGTHAAAENARQVAAAAAAYAAAEAANVAAAYAAAAAEAANDAATSAAYAAAAAAAAAAYAAAYADADVAAYAAADAADAAALRVSADIGLQALITLRSPGCQYLHLAQVAEHRA